MLSMLAETAVHLLGTCAPAVAGPIPCVSEMAAVSPTHMLADRVQAANAGGVAVSGLEMCQNSARLLWHKEEVDDKLHTIMVRPLPASYFLLSVDKLLPSLARGGRRQVARMSIHFLLPARRRLARAAGLWRGHRVPGCTALEHILARCSERSSGLMAGVLHCRAVAVA